MKYVGFDTETFCIGPGVAAPKMVCLSYYDGERAKLLNTSEGVRWFADQIRDPDTTLIGHHVFYDLGVLCAEKPSLLPWVFRAIEEGRVRCTKIREQLLLNATGDLKYEWDDDLAQFKKTRLDLQRLVYKYLGIFIKKGEDTYRTRYGTLFNEPFAVWPKDAKKYALKDAVYPQEVFWCQQREAFESWDEPFIPGEVSQTKAAWALTLMGIWGLRTDPVVVDQLRKELRAAYADQLAIAEQHGLVVNGKRKMAPIRNRVVECYAAHGRKAPLSKSEKNISTSRETLTFARYPSWEKDEGLMAVAEVGRIGKLLTTYLPIIESGTRVPITPSWNVMVESFRTSCSQPNVQNQPRGTRVREAYIPRPGRVYVGSDYSTLEMATLAQNCIDFFGYSYMAEALHEGKDLHLVMASGLLGITYEDAVKRYEAGDPDVVNARQLGKIPNFGAPGGMGPDALVDFARAYGIELTRDEAFNLIQQFKRTFGMHDYFSHCSHLTKEGVCRAATHPRTGLTRGGVHYTALCNHWFQHLAACGAKEALYQVVKESYVDCGTALFGCRPVVFAHDEIILEADDDAERIEAAASRLSEIMVREMKVFCPDVPIEAEAVAMRRWFKGAKPVRDSLGRLVPSKPVKKGDKTVWVADNDNAVEDMEAMAA